VLDKPCYPDAIQLSDSNKILTTVYSSTFIY